MQRASAFIGFGEAGAALAGAVSRGYDRRTDDLATRAAKLADFAAAAVAYLSDALIGWYRRGDDTGLSGYGTRVPARVWKAERFSWYLTKLMHRFPEDSAFERRMQLAELDYIAQSTAMQTAIAENYVGLPL